jgi:hypothetical protein
VDRRSTRAAARAEAQDATTAADEDWKARDAGHELYLKQSPVTAEWAGIAANRSGGGRNEAIRSRCRRNSHAAG